MPPRPTFYDSSDVAAAADETIAQAGGTTSTPVTYHLWNDKGGLSGDTSTLTGARLRAEYFDGSQWQIANTPALDESWARARVHGIDNTGDPTMADQDTGVVPLGTLNGIVLSDIPKDCARYVTVYWNLPIGASTITQNLRINLIYSESSEPLSTLAAVSGGGVLPDRLVAGIRRLRRGRSITASGTANVVVTAGAFSYDQIPTNVLAVTKTLNQNDSVPSALTAGQSYIAVLSQKSDGTVTVTKGTRAVSTTTPDTPSGEIYLGFVTVGYQGGGTSIINTADVDMTGVIYGEYLVQIATGLNVSIGAGHGLVETNSHTFIGQSSLLGVTASMTNYIWLRPDGTHSASTTSTPPEFGAELLATAVVGVGSVTSVTNVARPVDHAINEYPLELEKIGAINATATDCDWAVVPFDAYIESVVLEVGTAGTAASGSFKVDAKTRPAGTPMGTAGTTIYTSSGTDDQRPSIAYNATVLRTETFNHEINTLTKGQRVSFDIVAVPGTITVNPTDVRVILNLRRK